MRVVRLLLVILATVLLAHCTSDTEGSDEGRHGTSQDPLCIAEWSPTWSQGGGANEWWVEYAIQGATVRAAYLEIPGVRNVMLTQQYGKWVGSAGSRIPTGTQVIVHAETTSGARAQTVPFGYLSTSSPTTDPCTGGGGGNGSCDGVWAPTFSQGGGANEWWVEYVISEPARAARLEVSGGVTVTLTYEYGKWRGKPSARIATGAQVTVHAESTSGQTARTVSFRYLVDTRPPTEPCVGGSDAGGGSGGTDAGSCSAWSFQQGSGANEWWVEYAVSGTTLRSASLAIVGGTEITLSYGYGKWRGAPSSRIPTGTSVILRGESTDGARAETAPFPYLLETSAATMCRPAGELGLDARPRNDTCVAPAQPPGVTTHTMRFERVFPNVAPARVMAIAQPPGDGARWFLLNREGKIYSFTTTSSSATPVLVADFPLVSGKTVRTELSGGMLGLAFHPSFASNGRLYVSFTTSTTTGLASEVGYLRSTDGGRTFSSYTRVFGFARSRLEWNGGAIAFGPDGYLYLGFGAEDTDGAQSTSRYFGKILRIDVDQPSDGRGYGIPATNPYASGGGLPEIYARGFRQPWRISFDRATGDLWASDAGQSSWEEIDRVELGKNYGWPCREGAHVYSGVDGAMCPSTSNLVDPVFEYAADGPAAAIGGYVYRGAAAPDFHGTYVFGDYAKQKMMAFRYDAATRRATAVVVNEGGATVGVTSFAEDSAGEIYATSVWQNGIYKLVAVPIGTSTFPDRLSRMGCFVSSDPQKLASGVIPYRVNAPLWSDGLDKERGLGLPNGTRIGLRSDGDFDLPIGTVLTKTFSYAGRHVETRLFMRHADGAWAGYSYEWNDTQTDALLLPGEKIVSLGDRSWTFPSRSDCMRCHTAAAGFTLGLELGQLNGDQQYASTGRTANQLATLEHIGAFATTLPASPQRYPTYDDAQATAEGRARSYLHANCSGCHRPNGGAGRSTMDLRYATSFAGTGTCRGAPVAGDVGVPGATLVEPGSPDTSIVSIRLHRLDGSRMPPLASRRVDGVGTGLVDEWIHGLTGCP